MTENSIIFGNQSIDLDRLIRNTEYTINHNKKWEDYHIRISYNRGKPQYYISGPGIKRTYVRKKDLDNVKKIVRLDYAKKVHKVLLKLKREGTSAGDNAIELINDVYENMHEARKIFITPVIPSNEAFINEWKEAYPANRNYYYGEGTYVTNAGEKVRSKSEKIIADMLYSYGVPYQYETEIILNDYKTCYPDFITLNVKKRKTILWEHLGLASDEQYASRNIEKLYNYEMSGYEMGDNLIVTMETELLRLNVSFIEEKIQKYLL